MPLSKLLTDNLDAYAIGRKVRDEETTLTKGDSVYFDSSQQHGYRRVDRKACRALVVIAPGASDPD